MKIVYKSIFIIVTSLLLFSFPSSAFRKPVIPDVIEATLRCEIIVNHTDIIPEESLRCTILVSNRGDNAVQDMEVVGDLPKELRTFELIKLPLHSVDRSRPFSADNSGSGFLHVCLRLWKTSDRLICFFPNNVFIIIWCIEYAYAV